MLNMSSVPRKAAGCDSGDRTGDRSLRLQSKYKDHGAKSREGTGRRHSIKVQGKARGGVSDSLRQKRSGREERMRGKGSTGLRSSGKPKWSRTEEEHPQQCKVSESLRAALASSSQ